MAMRTSFTPRALTHELTRSRRQVKEGCNIINIHRERVGGLERAAGCLSTGV